MMKIVLECGREIKFNIDIFSNKCGLTRKFIHYNIIYLYYFSQTTIKLLFKSMPETSIFFIFLSSKKVFRICGVRQ